MPAPPPVILLPPSEGKTPGGDGPPAQWHEGVFGAALGDLRCEVRDAVRRALRNSATAQALLGVRGLHLQRALDEWVAIETGATVAAAQRYSGVVWMAVGLHDLPAPARRRLLSRVLVPSGLWGLVSATDPLPAYRLKMGARVAPMGLLSAWWRPAVTKALIARARRAAVIDLLPQEHAAAIDWPALRAGARVCVEIVDDAPGGRRSVGHAGKSLKGALARAMLIADARTANDIASLKVQGLGPGSIEDHGGAVVFARTA